ncbi:hypothetical protein [Synechococcus sp. CBW1004]|uniref:hypothetical protein n=1 Tax=Synechococcus sp. CBW1004 TaxID=1353136 RepID=UPI0018CF4A93|nr:hypothetical protein [Synechococcus sp. CBW1004]QPN64311.1 hypothetical protein H8F25_06000 [Synechococcus sp. CBW1004]
MNSLIITTAVSYRPADIWPFLASAARFCPEASILAIVHQRDLPVLAPCCARFPALTLHPLRTTIRDIQHAQGLRFKLQRGLARLRSRALALLPGMSEHLSLADEKPSPLGLSSQRMFILNRRFFIARRLLRSLSAPPDAVLLSDSRDVVFQADPFASMHSGCCTGQEYNTMDESPINAHWIRSTYGESGFERLVDLPVLCSGVTIGSFRSVLAYLDQFCAEIGRRAVERRSVLIPIWDQAYHNMILRRDPPADLVLMPWHSQLATVGEVPPEALSVEDDGRIAVDDAVPAILHQYDRHPPAVASIAALYPPPESVPADSLPA